jgi:hypothetical protein
MSLDAYERNELRLKALARVDAASRDKFKLGRVLEVHGDSADDVRYVLNFNQLERVLLPVLKLKGIVGLPGLGARVWLCFGNPGQNDIGAVDDFLQRPELANLQMLDCYGLQIKSASKALEKSPHLGSLTYLDLGRGLVELPRLLAARSLTNLRFLGLSGNRLDCDDLLAILESPLYKHVDRLAFAGNNLADGFEKVAASPELARLRELSMGESGRKSWQVLTKSKHLGGLEKLSLAPGPKDASAGRLLAHEGFTSLRDLRLSCMGPASYKPIAIPKLSRLEISVDHPKSIKALAADPALAQLEHLELRMWNQSTQQAIGELYASPHFRKLASLTIQAALAESDPEAPIYQLPPFERLRRFELSQTPMTEPFLERMLRNRPFRHLEELELAGDLDAGAAGLLAACTDLSALKELRIPHGEIGDEGIIALAESQHLHALQVLVLGHANARAAGVAALADSASFRDLVTLWLRTDGDLPGAVRAPLIKHKKMPKLWTLIGLGQTADHALRESKY